jgi:hypothetical protein
MMYKPEAVVDLDTGAAVQAEAHPGNQTDHLGVAGRILEAQQTINEPRAEEPDVLTVQTVTSDKGYYAVNELEALQNEEIKMVGGGVAWRSCDGRPNAGKRKGAVSEYCAPMKKPSNNPLEWTERGDSCSNESKE